jgi:glutamyl-tRNA reductase
MHELLVLGISHKTAPVGVRERLALTDGQTERLLHELIALDDVHEAAAVSTCNRAEAYLVVGDPVRAESELLTRFAELSRIRPIELAGLVYSPRNCDAARHLYRVVSGLDSMIIGEYEIQGQVRRSYEHARRLGTTGPLLSRLFEAALRTGKRVRSETRIAERRTSVASVAVDLAAGVVGALEDRDVVIVGAGETAELTAQALVARGVQTLFVSNRHADRAASLAERFGGRVGSLDALPDQLRAADIVVTSTASPHPVIERDALEDVMRRRRAEGDDRPLVLIDIAVPRDVDPDCAAVEGVAVYDMDDLQAVVARNLADRGEEAERATGIVEEEILRFARWMGQLDVTPTIADLRGRANQIVDAVVAENAGRWESASADDLVRAERLARTVVQRLLHEPTVRLKHRDGDAHGQIELLRELFGLDDPDAHAADVETRRAHAGARAAAGGGMVGGAGTSRPAGSVPDNVRPLAERRAQRS